VTAVAEIPASSWRLPDDACALLRTLVLKHKPALIVEAGSGRSTVVMAETLREIGVGKVVSLEHELQFAAETVALLHEHGLEDHASVRYAPLEPHGKDLLVPNWYQAKSWNHLEGIGMLMVDGPPGGTARYARHPALPLLRDRLLPGCVIVLDDVNRDPEKTIWKDWGITGKTIEHQKAKLAYGTLK
jgi:predicted O-methyltransferase YrrM